MYSHRYFTHAWIDYPVTDCLLTGALGVGKLPFVTGTDITAAVTNVYQKTPCLIATWTPFAVVWAFKW